MEFNTLLAWCIVASLLALAVPSAWKLTGEVDQSRPERVASREPCYLTLVVLFFLLHSKPVGIAGGFGLQTAWWGLEEIFGAGGSHSRFSFFFKDIFSVI